MHSSICLHVPGSKARRASGQTWCRLRKGRDCGRAPDVGCDKGGSFFCACCAPNGLSNRDFASVSGLSKQRLGPAGVADIDLMILMDQRITPSQQITPCRQLSLMEWWIPEGWVATGMLLWTKKIIENVQKEEGWETADNEAWQGRTKKQVILIHVPRQRKEQH